MHALALTACRQASTHDGGAGNYLHAAHSLARSVLHMYCTSCTELLQPSEAGRPPVHPGCLACTCRHPRRAASRPACSFPASSAAASPLVAPHLPKIAHIPRAAPDPCPALTSFPRPSKTSLPGASSPDRNFVPTAAPVDNLCECPRPYEFTPFQLRRDYLPRIVILLLSQSHSSPTATHYPRTTDDNCE